MSDEDAPIDIVDLERSAEAGSVVAQSVVGICFLDGIYTAVDYEKAYRWLSKAAGRGAPRAVANLGRMYEHGLVVAQDLDEAIRLYEKAVDGGEFYPCVYLARLYTRAPFGDERAAARWYRRVLTFEGRVDADEELAEARSWLAEHDGGR